MSRDKNQKPLSAAELEAELERKRQELADTVDALTSQLDPRANLAELKSSLADTAANATDEAQAFVTRFQQGDQRTTQAVGLTLASVAGVLGLVLLRRSR